MFNNTKLNNKLLRDSNTLLKEEIARLKRDVSCQIEQFEIRNIMRDNDRLRELSLKNLELSREVALLKLQISQQEDTNRYYTKPIKPMVMKYCYDKTREENVELRKAIVNIALKI